MTKDTLFIFDCDGVLVDSEKIASEVFSRAVRELGLSMTAQEAQRRFRGRSLSDCLLVVEELLGRGVPHDFLDELRQATLRAFEGRLEVIPFVDVVLSTLRSLGLDSCVASNGDLEKMHHSLTLTGLLSYFQDESGKSRLFSAYQVSRGKPAPDLFMYAASQMGVPAERCVVIEDSAAGVSAALAAKMPVFAYAPDPAAQRSEVFDEPGVQLFSSMLELDELISRRFEP